MLRRGGSSGVGVAVEQCGEGERENEMISEKMAAALNKQVNAELYSAYLYLSMSAQWATKNLLGAANWFYVQAQEEMIHALKIYHFLHERGAAVTLTAIDGPPTEWATPLASFEDAYAHEQKVTGLINDLVNLAVEEKDHATQAFLQWFVTEQVEEEASADAVVQRLRMAKDSPGGLFIVDQELAARVFTPPPAAEGG